jgi:hypothetical protein
MASGPFYMRWKRVVVVTEDNVIGIKAANTDPLASCRWLIRCTLVKFYRDFSLHFKMGI